MIPPGPPRPPGSGDFDYQLPRPHRGPTVLMYGIAGLVVCFVCGIMAWVMGRGDLRAMRSGAMDRSGEGLTRAGMVLGIVGTVLNGLLLLVVLLALLGWLGPNFLHALTRSDRARAENHLHDLAIGLEHYRLFNRRLPARLEDLTEVSDHAPEPILSSIPLDPWDNPYEYRVTGPREYSLRSWGEDGAADTEDDIVRATGR